MEPLARTVRQSPGLNIESGEQFAESGESDGLGPYKLAS
jgi:hypothetical protein